MWTRVSTFVIAAALAYPAISVAQRQPRRSAPANFSITAIDTNTTTGDVYNVTGTFSTAGPLKPGVTITSWNISAGPHNFSNLESPWSNGKVFLAVSSNNTVSGDTYPNLGKSNCMARPDNLRIQFFNYLTGYFFTAYVAVGKLTGPGAQADLSLTENCLYFGGQALYSVRRSGLDAIIQRPAPPDPGWDHSNFTTVTACMLYESGSEACGFGHNAARNEQDGNYAEGTIVQF